MSHPPAVRGERGRRCPQAGKEDTVHQAGRGRGTFQSDGGKDPDPFSPSVRGTKDSPWDPPEADALMPNISIQDVICAQGTLGTEVAACFPGRGQGWGSGEVGFYLVVPLTQCALGPVTSRWAWVSNAEVERGHL